MESVDLFGRLERSKGENALTEALAICLSMSKVFRSEFLKKANVHGDLDNINIQTQQSDSEGRKRPDLWISSKNHLLLFEVKEDSNLTYGQWEGYKKILKKRSEISEKYLFGIIAPRTRVDPKISEGEQKKSIWRWPEVCRLASRALRVEKRADSVSAFLLEEFMNFLEVRGMKHFDGFSSEDLKVLRGIFGMSDKIKSFFEAVHGELTHSTSDLGRIGRGRYSLEYYSDDSEMYPGITFTTRAKKVAFESWIGLEHSSDLILSFGIWTKDMWPPKKITPVAQRLKQVLIGLGYEWYKNYGYYKPLKTKLQISEYDSALVQSVAMEVKKSLSEILAKIGG